MCGTAAGTQIRYGSVCRMLVCCLTLIQALLDFDQGLEADQS